ncbi:hypothetical protein F4778DRAFT_743456 [Xylariomycetidae sp. FL2044]|nr:hypothetical protein F4778DRAFT_743456 [Xylariomycetidae sp. FL2044]
MEICPVLQAHQVTMSNQFLWNLYTKAVRPPKDEYRSSAFGQTFLQSRFPRDHNYSVICEQPPDGSRRRDDIEVIQYNANHDTTSTILSTEGKPPEGSASLVEEQALDAAYRAVAKRDWRAMYVVTTSGTSYRFWYVAKKKVLERLDSGGPAMARRSTYVPAMTQGRVVEPALDAHIEFVKNEFPIIEPRIVPSQQFPASVSYQQQYPDPASGMAGSGYENTPASNIPSGSGTVGSGYGNTPASYSAEATKDSGVGNVMEVTVSKEPHSMRPDEYVFRDKKGQERVTKKKDWVEKDGWFFYRGGKMTYCCNQLPK